MSETHESPVEIDVDQLMIYIDYEHMAAYIKNLCDESYRAGRHSVIIEGEARSAILDGKTYWLDQADKAESSPVRSVALLIAESFSNWADQCRPTERPTLPPPPSYNTVYRNVEYDGTLWAVETSENPIVTKVSQTTGK